MKKILVSMLVWILWLGIQVSHADTSILYDTVKRGIGIRALSMGATGTSLGEGSACIFYNPAGLARRGVEYRFESLDFKNTRYSNFTNHLFYMSPIGFAYWKSEDHFNQSAEATVYGFGKKGRNGINWGLTYKNISYTSTTQSEQGWSSDLGMLAHINRNINFGVLFQDIFKNDIELPASFRTGFSLLNDAHSLVLSVEWDYDRSGLQDEFITHYGVEYNLTDGLTLRGGMFSDKLTGGVNIALPFAEIDYGVVADQSDPSNTLYLLGVKLGRGVQLPVEQRKYALVKDKVYAGFRIAGNLIEGKSQISLFGGPKIGSNDLLTYLHFAVSDPECHGIIMRISNLRSSLADIAIVQEIREQLITAKKEGKQIIAYIENWATLPEYYLASVADKIFMPDLGAISHLGLEMEIKKSKKLFENFGIENKIIASGKYKDSTNEMTDNLSEDEKDQLEDLLNSVYHQVVFDIKFDRTLSLDQIPEIFDGRIISAKDAKEKGLIDELGYWDDVIRHIESIDDDIRIKDLSYFYPPDEIETIFSPYNKIAVIEIDGEINLGENKTDSLFGGKGTGADEIDALVDYIKDDITIRAVILRINSPGGSIIASDRIYDSIQKLKESGKIVYSSMGNIATSGGYYIALNSDKIIANPGTLTGSIGVISTIRSQENFNKILGIEYDVLKTGKYMDMFSPNKSISPDELTLFKAFQEKQYNTFKTKLKENRKLDDEALAELAQGQVFTGKQAEQLNLIDKLGGFYDVVAELKTQAHIKGEPRLLYFRKYDQQQSRFYLPALMEFLL